MLHEPFGDMGIFVIVYNILLFEFFFSALLFLTGSGRISFLIQGVATEVFYLASFYTLRFRSKPVLPADLFSLRTAASVAENYDYTPDIRMVVSILAVCLLIVCAFLIPEPELTMRAAPFFSSLGGLVILCVFLRFDGGLSAAGFFTRPYTPDQAARHNGLIPSYIKNTEDLIIWPPEGYSAEEARKLLEEQTEPDQSQSENAGNLVIMMNEAFSDLSVLGDFPVNEDPIPFAHRVLAGKEPGFSSGTMHVSVLGGNTANTEFEVLTGLSMAFLPDGTIPYQQYLKGETESLASIFKERGYRTVALHPYYATGWHRNEAYPYMGFEEMRFVDDFRDPTYLRDYVDDASCVKEIRRLFEEKGEEELFVFNVTMQNHSSFIKEAENLKEDIETGLAPKGELDRYLSLLKYSDQAFYEMIEYFKSYPEPVTVVFFGDHEPGLSVSSPILEENGYEPAYLSDEMLRKLYRVPFFIWSNRSGETETNMELSANYLGNEVLTRMGIPLTPFRSVLEQVRQEYPVLSTQGYEDKEYKAHLLTEGKGKLPLLREYESLQYYELLDHKAKEKP